MTKRRSNVFAKVASAVCLVLSILLLSTFFMPVHYAGDTGVSFSNFDVVIATTYTTEDAIELTAQSALGNKDAQRKLFSYTAMKTEDENLTMTLIAHAIVVALSLASIIVSIVGICKRGAGIGSVVMSLLIVLACVLFTVFAFMTTDSLQSKVASGVYVALASAVVLLVTSITGKVLRKR